ncbi:cation diffusion facilitator family transporter [Georgenia soli]|uniref:Cation diffusion facilitator family transporter n=1 Tax=Georgenia soli TaxID=638953 RepID=A0A2A9EMM9_9MICO|nr:cation diffusion facilitator family transporter [Georgenia soli]PFG39505.1 cation diffusion facilitator family transporter [Georgenia soli]
MNAPGRPAERREHDLLFRYMLLSVAAAVVTIGLKTGAAIVTGSVGFLSDAMESGVNLVAAVVALISLRVAARPADASHHFGHGKAEYLSALVEGAMIFVAAAAIVWTSVQRLLEPAPLTQPGIGLALSTAASVLNLAVSLVLTRVGRAHRSPTLIADGKHLMTDVWTSAGVLLGIFLVAVTGWHQLDPIVALAVGLNILVTGYRLLRGSVSGLLSAALPAEDMRTLDEALSRYRQLGVTIAPLRTVESGRQRYVFVVATLPGTWTVAAAHEVADQIESDVDTALPGTETFVHIEPDGPRTLR